MSKPRRIVITGSTRGIGKGLAGELLRRGHDVAISGRSQASVDAAIAQLESAASGGARVIGKACDAARLEDLQALWDLAAASFGRVDVWLNNAGYARTGARFIDTTPQQIEAMVRANVIGSMNAAQVALRGMQGQSGGGLIYNMEGFGSNGMMTPGMSLYGASKFALTYFNKALLAETGEGPVKICYLSPGIVITDLLKRDMGSNDPQDWERTKRVYNILADRVETVTPWLADGILKNQKAGARVAWLTGAKAGGRFFMSLFRKRQLITDADLAP